MRRFDSSRGRAADNQHLTRAAPTIDLVLGTSGARPAELCRFVDGLAAQTTRTFRLILVDQSPGAIDSDRLELERIGSALVVRNSELGVSRARNAGLAEATADVVAFPDDDCWYPPALLERVAAMLGSHAEWDGVAARSLDASGRPSNLRWDPDAGPVDRFNCWRRVIAYGLFLRRDVLERVGGLDEELCVPFASGGETDLTLRVLRAGSTIWYDPSLTVHHPQQSPRWSRASAARGYRYGVGAGIIMRRFGYPIWFVGWRIGQLLAGAGYLLLRGRPADARYYLAMAHGRLRGWLA